jgi:hypothetical protein
MVGFDSTVELAGRLSLSLSLSLSLQASLAIIDANEEIDLLLTDVMMRGSINGRQLAVAALSRRPFAEAISQRRSGQDVSRRARDLKQAEFQDELKAFARCLKRRR